MTILSVVSVLLLAIVAAWFFWPMIADPIARRMSGNPESEADQVAEHLFAAWAKYGQGTSHLIRADRS